mgnify:CR=1 FL=1
MFVFILAAMVLAMLFGAPLIQNVYDMFGVDKQLPVATQIAIKLSQALVKYWYVVLAVIAGIYIAFRGYLASSIGRYQWDKFKIKAPVFGTLNLNIITNKFFQAMLLNLKNGMRIQESLETSKSVTDNYYFLSLIETAKNNLQILLDNKEKIVYNCDIIRVEAHLANSTPSEQAAQPLTGERGAMPKPAAGAAVLAGRTQ